MKLIVDTNRILAALIKNGLSRKIVTSGSFELYAPNYVLDEVMRHIDYVFKKSGISRSEIKKFLLLFMENLTIINDAEIKVHIEEARKIIGHIDINDAPILACALAIKCGIWTEDKHFEKQNKIDVWHTKDLIGLLK